LCASPQLTSTLPSASFLPNALRFLTSCPAFPLTYLTPHQRCLVLLKIALRIEFCESTLFARPVSSEYRFAIVVSLTLIVFAGIDFCSTSASFSPNRAIYYFFYFLNPLHPLGREGFFPAILDAFSRHYSGDLESGSGDAMVFLWPAQIGFLATFVFRKLAGLGSFRRRSRPQRISVSSSPIIFVTVCLWRPLSLHATSLASYWIG